MAFDPFFEKNSCAGDTGAAGATGATGAQGFIGTAGPTGDFCFAVVHWASVQ